MQPVVQNIILRLAPQIIRIGSSVKCHGETDPDGLLKGIFPYGLLSKAASYLSGEKVWISLIHSNSRRKGPSLPSESRKPVVLIFERARGMNGRFNPL